MTDTVSAISAIREIPLDPGGSVDIVLVASDLRIRGIDGDRVIVRSRDGGPLDGKVRIEAAPGIVRIRDGEGSVHLGPLTVHTRRSPDLDIDLPRTAAVTLRTVSGDVEALGIGGASRWASTSGDLRVTVSAGPVQLEIDVGRRPAGSLGGHHPGRAHRVRRPQGQGTAPGRPRRQHHERRRPGRGRPGPGQPPRDQLGLRRRGRHHRQSGPPRGPVDRRRCPGERPAHHRGRAGPPDAGRGQRIRGAQRAHDVGRRAAQGPGRAREHRPDGPGRSGRSAASGRSRRPAVPGRHERPFGSRSPCGSRPADGSRSTCGPCSAHESGGARADRARADRARADRARADRAGSPSAAPEPRPIDDEDTQPWNASAPAIDRREDERLGVLRALERGDLDVEAASRRLEALDEAGPSSFRGWC